MLSSSFPLPAELLSGSRRWLKLALRGVVHGMLLVCILVISCRSGRVGVVLELTSGFSDIADDESESSDDTEETVPQEDYYSPRQRPEKWGGQFSSSLRRVIPLRTSKPRCATAEFSDSLPGGRHAGRNGCGGPLRC